MALSYCGQMTRRHDPDRFLLSLFSPADKREALWALYAFNHEIAKTREVVTETQLGLIRLQWWCDALAGIYDSGAVLKHQIIEPLAEAIAVYKLPRALFDNLIYAREFDLEDRMPGNLQGMVSYANFTSTPLLELSLLILGEKKEKAEEAATAYAMAGLLRAVPFHFRQRRCYLPEDLMASTGVTFDSFCEGRELEALAPVVKAVTNEITYHLNMADKTTALTRRMNKLTRLYLRQIEAAHNDLFSINVIKPIYFKEIRLLLS